MAFAEITKGKFKGATALVSCVRVFNTKGNAVIKISKDIMAKLGDPMFFKVAIGTGQHKGLVALIPARAKSANTYKVSPQNSITISAKSIGISKIETSTDLAFEITEDGLVLDIKQVLPPARGKEELELNGVRPSAVA